MFQLSVWCGKWVAARRNSVIGNQLLFANNRNMVRWVVLCLSLDGACTDSFENFREISLKGDLSKDITLNPPLFSLVNTFKLFSKLQNQCLPFHSKFSSAFFMIFIFYRLSQIKLNSWMRKVGFGNYKKISQIVIEDICLPSFHCWYFLWYLR